jgi:hypothetical protein
MNRPKPSYRSKILLKIQTYNLSITLCYKSFFVSCHHSILICCETPTWCPQHFCNTQICKSYDKRIFPLSICVYHL